jgi:hypothetical protein
MDVAARLAWLFTTNWTASKLVANPYSALLEVPVNPLKPLINNEVFHEAPILQ